MGAKSRKKRRGQMGAAPLPGEAEGGVRPRELAGAAGAVAALAAVAAGSYVSKLPAVFGAPILVPFWTATAAAFLTGLRTAGAVLYLTAAFCGTGELLRRRFFAGTGAGSWERWVLRFSLGYAAAAGAFFVLAAAGLLSRKPLFAAFAVGTCAALYAALTREEGPGPEPGPRVWSIRSPLHWGCALVLLSAAAGTLPYALIPETFHDALKYHLELPALYLLEGGMVATPRNIFSGIPSMPQMVYGWTLVLSPDGSAARLLHWSAGLWVLAGLMALSRRAGRPEAGPLAGAIFFSAPVVLVESFRTSVGMEWALFELLSIHAFLAAAGEVPGGEARRRWLVLCGLATGVALASKYPAWVYPAGFVLGLLWIRSRGPARAFSPRESLVPFVVAAGVLLPWLVKNAALYGNPIYPYYHDLLRPLAPVQPNWRSLSDFWDWRGILTGGPAAREFLSVPWTLTAGAEDVGKSFGPVFLGLCPVVFAARFDARIRLLGVLALGCFAPLLLMTDYPRYFVPHLAGLSVFLAAALVSVPGRGARGSAAAAALAAAAAGNLVFLSIHPRRANWPVLLGRMSRSEFLGHTRHEYPDPPFAAYEYLNEHSPPGARVLVIGDGRGFYLRRPHNLSTLNQASAFEDWANQSADAEALVAEFRRRGIDWVVVNHGEMSRTHMEMNLTPSGRASADAFIASKTRRVFEAADPRDRRVAVYRLVEP